MNPADVNPVETYLRRATRGLYGRKRLEARQELESHLFERTRQLMAAGMAEAQVQRQVLEELGAPAQVSAGLLRVHTLPLALPALALALAAGGAGLLVTQAAAQVKVPVSVYTGREVGDPGAVYVKASILRAAFARAGVQMTGPDDSPTLSAKGLKSVPMSLGDTSTARDGLRYVLNFQTQTYVPFIDVTSVATWAVDQGWPVKVSGWDKPELTIGPALLILNGTRTAEQLYLVQARNRLFGGVCATKTLVLKSTSVISYGYGGISGYNTHTLATTSARPGQIYALAIPYLSEAPEAQRYNNYYVSVTQAGPGGRLTFKLPAVAQYLRFVTRLDATNADFHAFQNEKSTYQDPDVRGSAILFPLNGSMNFESCKTALMPLNFTGTSDSP